MRIRAGAVVRANGRLLGPITLRLQVGLPPMRDRTPYAHAFRTLADNFPRDRRRSPLIVRVAVPVASVYALVSSCVRVSRPAIECRQLSSLIVVRGALPRCSQPPSPSCQQDAPVSRGPSLNSHPCVGLAAGFFSRSHASSRAPRRQARASGHDVRSRPRCSPQVVTGPGSRCGCALPRPCRRR